MKRGRIRIDGGRCYHVTHRCQERRFLLRFEIDRKSYVDRLREAKKRYDVDILDYMITSNHVHLLLHADRGSSVSEAMHFIQGASARDYNRRKSREGSFWCGRFRPTLIQDGVHLARCIIYIALNMVRAGQADHPGSWKSCGYHELAGIRERDLIINRERLLSCLGHRGDTGGFVEWYQQTILEKMREGDFSRQSIWTEASAVGDLDWIDALAKQYGIGRKAIIEMNEASPPLAVREERASYGLKLSDRTRADFAFGKI